MLFWNPISIPASTEANSGWPYLEPSSVPPATDQPFHIWIGTPQSLAQAQGIPSWLLEPPLAAFPLATDQPFRQWTLRPQDPTALEIQRPNPPNVVALASTDNPFRFLVVRPQDIGLSEIQRPWMLPSPFRLPALDNPWRYLVVPPQLPVQLDVGRVWFGNALPPRPPPSASIQGFGGRVLWQPKLQSETRTYWFDASQLGSNTIVAVNIRVSVYSGTDPNPSAILSGQPWLSEMMILQNITAGVVGTIYDVICTISTTDAQSLSQRAFLSITSDVT